MQEVRETDADRREQINRMVLQYEKEMLKLKWDLINIKNGWSFKIGRIITFLPRRINKWIKN